MTMLASAEFEKYVARQVAKKALVTFDQMIFCNIAGLSESNLGNYLTMPAESQIVHRANISRAGYVDENKVVYSAMLGTNIGDFEFNYIALINRAENVLAVACFTDTIRKRKNKGRTYGNSLSRNLILQFSGARELTGINIPAESWQVDFTSEFLEIHHKIDRLSDPDGFRYVGQCESIAQLRTIEPTEDQQRILVKSYHAGKNLGGGVFYADFADTTTADNAGTVIVTAGKRWKRLYTNLTPFYFGAICDGITDDSEAVNRMLSAGLTITGLGLTLKCSSVPPGYIFKNCRFKVGNLHYPTADYYQADFAKVTNGGIYMSHPQDTAYILGNQIKMWISTANAHLDSGVQPAMLMSEDGGTSYQAPALLDITRKQNTIWSAGVANGVEYLFERMTDVAPFSYRLHKRAVPTGDKANYYEPFITTELTFEMPSWSRDVQPVMIHSFAEFPGGFVVGASFTEGAGLYKSTDGGATYQFIELKQGSNYEEPTVKYENGVFAGFIRGGNDGARPSFWLSRDSLATIKVFTAPDNVFLNSKLQDVCIPLALVNNTVHGFTVARNGVEAGLSDEYAPIYYIKADISRTDNIWSNAEISLLGYCYHAEQGGASACGQGSVAVYRNKLMFYYGSEERTGANKTGNRIANIHCITLSLNQSATAVNFDDKAETLRAAEYFQTIDGRTLLPHGKTVLRRERLATQKYHQAPNIADDFLIVGNASSTGVTVLTDGPYSSFLSLDHENKMAGFRVDNTNGAVQILAKGEIALLYDPTTKSFYPRTKNQVELGKAGNALKHIYVQSGTIDTPEVNANNNEIVNAKWVNRQWSNLKSDIGWAKRPDGLIEQWGTIYIGANGTANVELPIAFPSKFLNVVLTPDKPRNGHSVIGKTLSNFTLKNTEGTECNYMWRAIGY